MNGGSGSVFGNGGIWQACCGMVVFGSVLGIIAAAGLVKSIYFNNDIYNKCSSNHIFDVTKI